MLRVSAGDRHQAGASSITSDSKRHEPEFQSPNATRFQETSPTGCQFSCFIVAREQPKARA